MRIRVNRRHPHWYGSRIPCGESRELQGVRQFPASPEKESRI